VESFACLALPTVRHAILLSALIAITFFI